MPKVLDLFCGMGGLSLGFALALEGAEITGYDIDSHAVETYNFNLSRLGCRAFVADLLKKRLKGEWDLVIAGTPCQPFSFATRSKTGKDHPLYPTFPKFFDTVLKLRPKVFVMENVKGLVSRKFVQLFEEQVSKVSGLYKVSYRVLNAADYGVPQKRERLFVIGFRKDLGIEPSFPKPTHASEETMTLDGKLHKWVTVREAIGDLLESLRFGSVMFTHKRSLTKNLVERTWRPFFSPDEPSFTVTKTGISEVVTWDFSDESMTKHKPQNLDEPARTIRASFHKTPPDALVPLMVKPETIQRILRSGVGLRVHKLDEPAKTIKPLVTGHQNIEPFLEIPPTTEEVMSKPSPVLVADARIYATRRREHGTDAEKGCYRRLTVRECLRLQSFPDWWGFPEKISRTRMYKLVGEAVPPILAYRLAIHVGKLMHWDVREPPKEEEWSLPYFHRAFPECRELR